MTLKRLGSTGGSAGLDGLLDALQRARSGEQSSNRSTRVTSSISTGSKPTTLASDTTQLPHQRPPTELHHHQQRGLDRMAGSLRAAHDCLQQPALASDTRLQHASVLHVPSSDHRAATGIEVDHLSMSASRSSSQAGIMVLMFSQYTPPGNPTEGTALAASDEQYDATSTDNDAIPAAAAAAAGSVHVDTEGQRSSRVAVCSPAGTASLAVQSTPLTGTQVQLQPGRSRPLLVSMELESPTLHYPSSPPRTSPVHSPTIQGIRRALASATDGDGFWGPSPPPSDKHCTLYGSQSAEVLLGSPVHSPIHSKGRSAMLPGSPGTASHALHGQHTTACLPPKAHTVGSAPASPTKQWKGGSPIMDSMDVLAQALAHPISPVGRRSSTGMPPGSLHPWRCSAPSLSACAIAADGRQARVSLPVIDAAPAPSKIMCVNRKDTRRASERSSCGPCSVPSLPLATSPTGQQLRRTASHNFGGLMPSTPGRRVTPGSLGGASPRPGCLASSEVHQMQSARGHGPVEYPRGPSASESVSAAASAVTALTHSLLALCPSVTQGPSAGRARRLSLPTTHGAPSSLPADLAMAPGHAGLPEGALTAAQGTGGRVQSCLHNSCPMHDPLVEDTAAEEEYAGFW